MSRAKAGNHTPVTTHSSDAKTERVVLVTMILKRQRAKQKKRRGKEKSTSDTARKKNNTSRASDSQAKLLGVALQDYTKIGKIGK